MWEALFDWIFKNPMPPVVAVVSCGIVWLWIRGLHADHRELRENHKALDVKNEKAHKEIGLQIEEIKGEVGKVGTSCGEIKGYVKGLHEK